MADYGKDAAILEGRFSRGVLVVGAEVFLRFAVECGAIDEEERGDYLGAVRAGLAEASEEIRSDRAEQPDPCEAFLIAIRTALSTGKAYVGTLANSDAPDGIEAHCGWHPELRLQGGGVDFHVWKVQPNAPQIGWTDGHDIFLNPQGSYSMFRQMNEANGEGLAITQLSLGKYLIEAGVVRGQINGGKKRAASRVTIGSPGKQVSVLQIACTTFWPESPTVHEVV